MFPVKYVNDSEMVVARNDILLWCKMWPAAMSRGCRPFESKHEMVRKTKIYIERDMVDACCLATLLPICHSSRLGNILYSTDIMQTT